MWEYRATIENVVDGDTFDATLDLGFYTYRRERLRLLGSTCGVDTPELNDHDPAVRAQANAARTRVLDLMPMGSAVIVRTQRRAQGDPRDGFGRFLAEVLLPDGTNLGDLLLTEGLAVPYHRGASK